MFALPSDLQLSPLAYQNVESVIKLKKFGSNPLFIKVWAFNRNLGIYVEMKYAVLPKGFAHLSYEHMNLSDIKPVGVRYEVKPHYNL